jgi:hypothetical protein
MVPTPGSGIPKNSIKAHVIAVVSKLALWLRPRPGRSGESVEEQVNVIYP